MPHVDLPPVPPGRRGLILSRRRLLGGAVAVGAVGAAGGLGLSACGDGGASPSDDPGTSGATGTGGDRVLVLMLNGAASLAAGEAARLPLGLGDDRGVLVSDAPASLTFRVETVDGDVVEDGVEVPRHDAGLPRAYFPLAFTPSTAGYYRAVTTVDGTEVEANFEVAAPGAIAIPRPGQPFPRLVTPTAAAPGGVDPICTSEPACALHDVDAADVVGTEAVALLVSTPAFCTTAICGPVLDLLAEATPPAGVRRLHVEVYRSAAEVAANPTTAALAPAVGELGLVFEPCLFLVGADGVLRRRLDVIFDRTELDAALAELAP